MTRPARVAIPVNRTLMAMKLNAIHPFPARMAPDTLSKWIADLPSGSTVLDPMCGSGVVVRQSLLAGHKSIGLDIDPLAVLMSRIWTRRFNFDGAVADAISLCGKARNLRIDDTALPWMDNCQETTNFTKYWFASRQRHALRKLAFLLRDNSSELTTEITDLLWLALSRTIITKQAGASLAWDISHSRPHKVLNENDFDVFNGFIRAIKSITKALSAEILPRHGRIRTGDSRNLKSIKPHSIDAIFTSPPYLNAIDYLRGHKFSLIWMGHTIPQLRDLRSDSIGAERAPKNTSLRSAFILIAEHTPAIRSLPLRYQRIIERYVYDAFYILREFKRVLKPKAQLALVLGDSSIKGHYILILN